MQTSLTLEERYCDAIFNQGKDFSEILVLMLNGQDLPVNEPLPDAAGVGVVQQEINTRTERIDIFTILSIYQKATLAQIKDTHTDTMLLHFLAHQSSSENPKIKQFTSRVCGDGFFAPVLDSSSFHLDLSLLETALIFPAICAYVAYLYQKPHGGFSLNLIINQSNEVKVAELRRAICSIFSLILKDTIQEQMTEQNYVLSFNMNGNLIPSYSSAFRPVFNLKEEAPESSALETQMEPPSKKPKKESESDFFKEFSTTACFPI